MINVTVQPGVCGFATRITADSEDMQNVQLNLETECPNIKPMETELTEADGFAECFSKIGDSTVYQMGKKYCRHAACPVPCAIIKGIEAACELALPRDVEIKIEKK